MFKLDLEKAEETDQIANICWIIEKARVPEKHLLLLYCQSIWLCTTTNSGKFLNRWEYQITWPASWETCMQVRKQQLVRIGHGTTDWFKTGKRVHQGCILSSCLFNLNAEYIMRNAGLDEAQAGIKIAGRNINNLRCADDTTLMAESEELKSLLWKWKRRVKKLA